MIFKTITFAALIAAVYAQHNSHGHATSSQSIIRHDVSHNQGYNHIQPVAVHAPISYHQPAVAIHSAPLIQHTAPVIQHATPIIQHSAPIIQHSAPIIQHSAPIIQHSAPIIQHAAPIVQHAAPLVHHAAPVHYNQASHGHEDYYAHPKYEFEYSVQDTHTGDIKSQHEARDGDHVSGSYSLHQPDGSVRTVHYNVEGHSGFNAQVEHSAPSTHVQPVAHHAPQVLLAHH